MSNLRLIIDENIPEEIASILSHKGHDVLVPTRRLDDTEIGRLARRERRIILTQDKDFTNPFIFPPKDFHGIIRLRIHPPVIEDIVGALDELFAGSTMKTMDGKLIVVERSGSRVME